MAATQHEGFNLSFVMNFSGSYNCLFPDIFFFKLCILGLQKNKALHSPYQWGCAQTTLNRASTVWSQHPTIPTGSTGERETVMDFPGVSVLGDED